MSPELEWTVEYETLPSDEAPWGDPEPSPSSPRPPRWLWWLIAIILILAGGAAYLYSLGGRIDRQPEPPPETDTADSILSAVVAMEIDAFNRRDRDIYDQIQDSQSYRQNQQPPPDLWFQHSDGSSANENRIELVAVQVNDSDSGVAQIELGWEGEAYRLYWYYTKKEGRWLHTDWQPMQLGASDLLTSQHVNVTVYGLERKAGATLIDRVDAFIDAFCSMQLPCPAEGLKVTLEFDTAFTNYSAENITDFPAIGQRQIEDLTGVQVSTPTPAPTSSSTSTLLHYRIPSPLRIRWPVNSEPEPLVLASIGRQIAYDLVIQPISDQLDPSNEAALTLATFWLVHQILESPQIPGTRWLNDSANGDQATVVAFIQALCSGTNYEEALTATFDAELVAAALESADYYGWLVRVTDPVDLIRPTYRRVGDSSWDNPYAYPQQRYNILDGLDWESQPWESMEKVYSVAVPDISHLSLGNSWAVATAELGQDWVALYFLKEHDERWHLLSLDDALADESFFEGDGPFTITEGPVTLIHWSWDKPFLDSLLNLLIRTVYATSTNFDIDAKPMTFSLIPIENPAGTPFAPEQGIITLISPAWMSDNTIGYPSYPVIVANTAIWSLIEAELPPADQIRGWGILMELLVWQGDQIAAEFNHTRPSSFYEITESWTAPPDASESEWLDLVDIWATYGTLTTGDNLEPWIYSRLIVQHILDQYGPSTLPAMLDGLATAKSLDEWINGCTDKSLHEFEPAWRQWVVEHYR